ncbi:ABC transporter ATP-binding protein [Actinopolymorpha alba]|uniref:ABC transporter ATP-binding protein n=1 Tax=Actinopolymorpha alba TaxID=533267 RepID=UPI0003604119|nr:energy-coupling factor transporter ATPase [Actinopolymorpha alba]
MNPAVTTNTAATDIVVLDRVSFTYEHAAQPALGDVTLRLPAGARIAITGPTGAGKTTLCMLLNGLIPHLYEGRLTGQVRVAGHDVARETVPQIVRDVGLVMQDPETQLTGRTVEEDAAVGPANLGCPRGVVRRRVDEALAMVGLSDLATRPTDQLSGGESQRLAIAGILAMEPRVLVLDEPTSELDPAGAATVVDLVRRLAREQARTIVLVGHDPDLIAGWADLVVVVREGAVAFVGTPRELYRDPDRVCGLGLPAPQVTELGWRLVASGVLPADDLPFTLADAERVLLPRLAVGSTIPAQPAVPAPAANTSPRRPADVRTPPPTTPAIEVAGLTHTYSPGVTALADVDLTIDQGEFVALVGGNGAGKTTFAKHLNGLLRPSAGSVRVAGEDIAGRAVGELARLVGYVFQNPDHQIFCSSVAEEVAYGLRQQGAPEDEIDQSVARVLELVGLSTVADRHPFRLGKGQRQRLAVASVLALSPSILVIDEPTTGQDLAGTRSMMGLIDELHRSGHTVVLITHDMSLVARHAKRVCVFVDGRLAADRTPRDLFAQPDLLSRACLEVPPITRLAGTLADKLTAAGRPDAVDPATLDVASLAASLTDLLASTDAR